MFHNQGVITKIKQHTCSVWNDEHDDEHDEHDEHDDEHDDDEHDDEHDGTFVIFKHNTISYIALTTKVTKVYKITIQYLLFVIRKEMVK